MLKKTMLGIVALILLIGAENLLATEKKNKPKAKQKQGQVQKGRKKQNNKAKTKAKKAGAEKAKAAATARKRREQARSKSQQSRPGANLPSQQMYGRWLDELTKAYQENDKEKMGQLIRKMRQMRQRVRNARGAPGEAVRDFRGRPGAAPLEDVVRPLMPGRGMRGWGRGFQGRGMGGWGRGFRGRGMGMGQGFPGPWCPWLQDPEPEMD